MHLAKELEKVSYFISVVGNEEVLISSCGLTDLTLTNIPDTPKVETIPALTTTASLSLHDWIRSISMLLGSSAAFIFAICYAVKIVRAYRRGRTIRSLRSKDDEG